MLIYIGLEFVYIPIGIIFMQIKYVVVFLAQFNMMECWPVTIPKEGIRIDQVEN
jgi:hypothetical protein